MQNKIVTIVDSCSMWPRVKWSCDRSKMMLGPIGQKKKVTLTSLQCQNGLQDLTRHYVLQRFLVFEKNRTN